PFMSIVNPEIDQLLDKVDSKFTLCTLAAKRACQINDMVHGVREQALSAMTTSEIAKLTSAKPLALAMDEVARGDVSPEAPLSAGAGDVESITAQAAQQPVVAEVDVVDVIEDEGAAEETSSNELLG
ncbi:MAG: DNA-directed RNA polymerase subunit omega, partial [Coriobacteriia bacterium]|nr:DNA-directed RNA polymerase subunit omega [Coriobacteriia bacterium]